VLEVPVYQGKGRLGTNQQFVRTYYQIGGALYTPLEKHEEATQQLGLFILATNDINGALSMADMLSAYKSQQAVEKGFRFLKSPDFLIVGILPQKTGADRSPINGHDDLLNGLCCIRTHDP
jgi:transposase